jgi:RNA polymerase sigma-70 factor (ECF subfamily)
MFPALESVTLLRDISSHTQIDVTEIQFSRKEEIMTRSTSFAPERETHSSERPVAQRNEVQLLAAARRGRAEAFESLCQPYTTKLLKAAFYITRNREDAEDALQDSLLRAYSHINGFNGRSSFSTWLTRIVINSALMIRRKVRNARQVSADELSESSETRPHLQIPDLAPNPEQRLLQGEQKRILRDAIGTLRPRIRAVVEIGQLQERPMKETARLLDISVAAAKGRLFHARAALRDSSVLRSVADVPGESAA